MVMPMIIQLVGAVANIIFDPILIFNFNMGVAGAAYATVGGQILSMIVGLCILFFGNHAIALEFKGFRFHGKTMNDIYVVGLPSIVMERHRHADDHGNERHFGRIFRSGRE